MSVSVVWAMVVHRDPDVSRTLSTLCHLTLNTYPRWCHKNALTKQPEKEMNNFWAWAGRPAIFQASGTAGKHGIFPNWAVSVSGETGKPQKDRRGKGERKRGTSGEWET